MPVPRRDRFPEVPRGSGDELGPGNLDESSKNLGAAFGGRQCNLDRLNLVEPSPDTLSRVSLVTLSHSDTAGFRKRPGGTTTVPRKTPPRPPTTSYHLSSVWGRRSTFAQSFAQTSASRRNRARSPGCPPHLSRRYDRRRMHRRTAEPSRGFRFPPPALCVARHTPDRIR